MHNSGHDEILSFFEHQHLPIHLQVLSKLFMQLAKEMAGNSSGAETQAGLRKLVEAKDCAVRALLVIEKRKEAHPITMTTSDNNL